MPLERNLVDVVGVVDSGLLRRRFALISIDAMGGGIIKGTYMIRRKIGTALLQNALRFDSAAKASSDFQSISFISTNSA